MVTFVNIKIQRSIEKQLLDVPARDLHQYLKGPTIFELRAQYKRPFFASVLLHGNETSGWDAVRRFLQDYPTASMLLFVGNVHAAASGVRHLPHEPDFNRIWRSDPWKSEIDSIIRDFDPWCAVDFHNNSGPNPPYNVVTDQRKLTLALAKMFSDRVIFTDHTQDILARAISDQCPAVTIETGTINDPESERRAYEMLCALDERQWFPEESPCLDDFDAYKTLGIVKAKHATNDLATYPTFNPLLRNSSFQTLTAGTRFVESIESDWEIRVENPSSNEDLTHEFFDCRESEVFLARDVVLSMFTSEPLLAVQDCVCYFLTRTRFIYE